MLAKLINLNKKILVRENGGNVESYVSKESVSKLKYYLHCVNQVLDLSDVRDISKYADYTSDLKLNKNEKLILFKLCESLTPSYLNDKCFFFSDDSLVDSNAVKFISVDDPKLVHKFKTAIFFECGTKKCANNFPNAGVCKECFNRKVQKVMLYKYEWFVEFFHQPFQKLKRELFPTFVQKWFHDFLLSCMPMFLLTIGIIYLIFFLNIFNILMSIYYRNSCSYMPSSNWILFFIGNFYLLIFLLLFLEKFVGQLLTKFIPNYEKKNELIIEIAFLLALVLNVMGIFTTKHKLFS